MHAQRLACTSRPVTIRYFIKPDDVQVVGFKHPANFFGCGISPKLHIEGSAKSAIDAVLGDFSSDPEDAPLAARQAEVDRCFAADSVEAILANLAAEGTSWAEETRATLLEKSPTSLKITFRQLTQYGDLDFEAAMKIEYRMAIRCNFSHEFYEGIRAQIIDKDRQPKWRPATLEDVGADLVESYFQAPASGDMTFE